MFREKISQSLDSVQTFSDHRKIILRKPLLKSIYDRFYQKLFFGLNSDSGSLLEIGSGGYNAKDFHKKVLTSEFIPTPHTDLVIDAMRMDLKDNSVDAFIVLNALHHIPGPQLFFSEATRTLKVNGEIRLIEPYGSFWGNFIYKYLHHEDYYDSASWNLPVGKGRLTTANAKMPTLIFIRDISIFKQLNPNLTILEIEYLNIFSYLLSGGLSFRSPIPKLLIPFIHLIESLLQPFNKYLALFMFIKIKKNK